MAHDRSLAWFSNKIAVWAVTNVGTMRCAGIFAALALIALPQAFADSFLGPRFYPLPLVTWLSQSFLQLVLLSIIMAGQSVQAAAHEERDVEQHGAVMEVLRDVRTLLNMGAR